MENKHTIGDLYQMQSLPLSAKIRMTQYRIKQWYEAFDGDVYVSFSGGKDSTVLLDIARKMYPDIEAVFVNTGLEYPSVRKFALSKENVTELRPKMNFREVIIKYGYPIIGKRQARYIHDLQTSGEHNRSTVNLRLTGLNRNGEYCPTMRLPNKYLFMVDAPFYISDQCCDVMKKKPLKLMEKNKRPITAIMASESSLREKKWKKYGCNAFELKNPQSSPMSFWTENDVLTYIHENHLEIAEVYGDVVVDQKGEIEGQINIADALGDYRNCKFCTTGCKRTGCLYCGFGLTQDLDRYARLVQQEPKLGDYVLRGGEFSEEKMWQPSKNGLGFWFVLLWLKKFGNIKINIPNEAFYIKEYSNSETEKILNKEK